MPEWLKGTGCKPVGYAYAGSNPAPPIVEDQQAPSPYHLASTNLRRNDIDRALGSLSERDRQVIELRFGLNGEPPCTLEDVGRRFGVTRERIRQIENNTLKRLELLPECQGLRDAMP